MSSARERYCQNTRRAKVANLEDIITRLLIMNTQEILVWRTFEHRTRWYNTSYGTRMSTECFVPRIPKRTLSCKKFNPQRRASSAINRVCERRKPLATLSSSQLSTHLSVRAPRRVTHFILPPGDKFVHKCISHVV